MAYDTTWMIQEPDGPWSVAGPPPSARDAPTAATVLSPAETDILICLSKGMTNAEIAQHRNSSPATVRNQLHQLFAKLGARTRGQAVAVWWQRLNGSDRPAPQSDN